MEPLGVTDASTGPGQDLHRCGLLRNPVDGQRPRDTRPGGTELFSAHRFNHAPLQEIPRQPGGGGYNGALRSGCRRHGDGHGGHLLRQGPCPDLPRLQLPHPPHLRQRHSGTLLRHLRPQLRRTGPLHPRHTHLDGPQRHRRPQCPKPIVIHYWELDTPSETNASASYNETVPASLGELKVICRALGAAEKAVRQIVTPGMHHEMDIKELLAFFR
jgi:hypothetical protein